MGNELDRVDGDGASPDELPLRISDGELGRLTEYADAQERKVQELQATVAQLQFALEARVAIERAIGMLAERFNLAVYDAFEVIRSAARTSRREVRSLAEELLEDRAKTPPEIVEASARRARS
ncbi:MAG: ANTAR domain-containing protein [Gaiellaceae bacterium]